MSQQSFMATLFTVMRKEWRDFVRDRRTFLLTLLVAPLLYPVLFLGIGKQGFGTRHVRTLKSDF